MFWTSYIDRYIGSEHITLDYDMDWKMRDEPWMSEVQNIYKKHDPLKVVTIEKDVQNPDGNLDFVVLK